MNWRAIRAIVEKDLKVVLQSKAVTLPIIIVPTIMLIVIPIAYAIGARFASTLGPSFKGISNLDEMATFLQSLPAGLQAELATYNDEQRLAAFALTYFIAPLYLIIPLMVSSVIAADSLAGERERKTLEALAYTPTTDLELFAAKLLAAWIPALVVGLLGFVLYAIVANAAAWPVMGRIFFPNLMWVLLAIWVGPAAAGLGLAAMVLVSVRVASFQEANQLGGMVVLPIVLLVVGQATGVMYFSVELVVVLGLVLWTIDAALLVFGRRLFRRGQILARG